MHLINTILSAHKATSERGAAMGRTSWTNGEDLFLHLVPLPMEDGDYDAGGAYWGCGSATHGDMWVAFAPSGRTVVFVRAKTTFEATDKVLGELIRMAHDSPLKIHFDLHGDRVYSEDTTAESRWMTSVMIPPRHPRMAEDYLKAVRFTEEERLEEERRDMGKDPTLMFAEGSHDGQDGRTMAQDSIEDFACYLARHPAKCAEVFACTAAWADLGQVAHDIWLTRNGHGAGFWDRGHGAAGVHLTEMAETMGSQDAYIGDDGRVYLEQ